MKSAKLNDSTKISRPSETDVGGNIHELLVRALDFAPRGLRCPAQKGGNTVDRYFVACDVGLMRGVAVALNAIAVCLYFLI